MWLFLIGVVFVEVVVFFIVVLLIIEIIMVEMCVLLRVGWIVELLELCVLL